MATHDHSLLSIIALQETLPEAVLIGGDPDGLLGVVGLEHVLALHLHGDAQVGERVRVGLTGFAQFDVARHDAEVVRSFPLTRRN